MIIHIIISPVSKLPIYEQIKNQIRDKIMAGELKSGTQLPSIRILAKELQVGIITAKRAYDDLCEEGILISAAGKGVFVAELNITQVKNIQLEQIREQLSDIKAFAEGADIRKEDIINIIDELYGGKSNAESGN